MNATKRPWRSIERDGANGITIVGDEGHRTIDLAHVTTKSVHCSDNAALILRAVNAHDKLVEACKKALDECVGPKDALDQLAAAIALAEAREVSHV